MLNNAAFGKHRNIKTATTKRWRNYLVSEANHHTTKFLMENILAIEMRKTQILMNKPAYFGLSLLDLNEIVMYEFFYDYVKRKYRENAKLYYMDTGSFIAHVKTEDI